MWGRHYQHSPSEILNQNLEFPRVIFYYRLEPPKSLPSISVDIFTWSIPFVTGHVFDKPLISKNFVFLFIMIIEIFIELVSPLWKILHFVFEFVIKTKLNNVNWIHPFPLLYVLSSISPSSPQRTDLFGHKIP